MANLDGFRSGRPVLRSGTLDGEEIEKRLATIDSVLGAVRSQLSSVSVASSYSSTSSTTGDTLTSPDAPTLVVDGAYPTQGASHWLQANYPKMDPSGSTVVPYIRIRGILPAGIHLEESVYTYALGVWNGTKGLGITVTQNISSLDVTDGHIDTVLPVSDIDLGDTVYALIVAIAANGGYAENTYDSSARTLTAGSGISPPETPDLSSVAPVYKPHHTDYTLTVHYTYDSTEPYNGPNCCNLYDTLEVWKSKTASVGHTPDTVGTTGWSLHKTVKLQRLVKRIADKATDNKKSVIVNHNANAQFYLAFRITQTDGQKSAWTTATVGIPGIDDGDFTPGYIITSGAYAPGGASNPWSNAATDPGTGCWNAEEDIPGTPGKEVSARVRLYFTATEGGTTPAANANNNHAHIVIEENRSGRIRKHAQDLDVPTPATDTYIDFSFKHKFRKGNTCTITKGNVRNHGEVHYAAPSIAFTAGGGAAGSAPLAPTLGSPVHSKMSTVWPCTLNADATHLLTDLRKVELYVAPTGTTGTPDTVSAWKKRKTVDVEDDVAASRTSIELQVQRTGTARKAAIARCKDAYGQWGAWSAISDTGTPPRTDDDPPAVPAITSCSSYLKDLKGTPRKECDLTVNFTAPGCTDVEVAVADPDGTIKRRIKVTGSGTESVYWKHKFDYGDSLSVTIKGINGTAESAWSGATAITAGSGSASLPSLTALAPTITSAVHTKMGTVYTVTLPNNSGVVYDCVRKLQWWWAPTGTTAPTGQAVPTSTWKKVKTVEVDELAGGTNTTMEVEVNRPTVNRKAAVCRIVDAAGRKSDWSNGYDTGTPPDSDDDPPAIPTIGTVTSSLKDVKGTRRKECDLSIPLTFSGCTKVEVEVSDPDGVVSKAKVVKGLTTATVYWKHKFDQGDTLYYRWRGQNGTAYSDWSTADASWPGSAPSIVAGGAKGSTPAFTGLTILQAAKHHTIFEPTWNGANAGGYIYLDVEITEDGGTTWEPLKHKAISKLSAGGKCTIRVLHKTPYQKVQIRMLLQDRWDQESAYYPSSTGTDATWWSTGGSNPGDGDNPITLYPWTTSGTVNISPGSVIQVNAGASARLDLPLHKQKIGARMNLMYKAFNVYIGFLDDNQRNGYYLKFTSTTSAQLYKVDGAGSATAVGAAITFPALPLGADVATDLEIHRQKIVAIIGPASTRYEWTDTTYRAAGWKFWTWHDTSSYHNIYALTVNNNGTFYEGLAAANVQASLDADGFLNADNVQITIGSTKQKLSPMLSLVGSGIYLDGNYLRERAPVTAASVPTTNLRAGMIQPIYEAGGVGAGKYRFAMYIPANYFGAGVPAADSWFHANCDNSISAGTASSSTGGTGGTGGTCFTLDTLVRTPGGSKRYGDLVENDIILSLDQLTGEEVEDYVVAIQEHEAAFYLDLGFCGVTEEHYLYAWTQGKPPASCVQHSAGTFPLGGLLYGSSGPVVLKQKDVVTGTVPVRSITTSTKCYFVGDGSTWILAHNLKSLDI